MKKSTKESKSSVSELSLPFQEKKKEFTDHEDFCQNINHIISKSYMGNPTFKCNDNKSLGFEEYSKIFAAIQNLSLKNVDFSTEFYFEEILLCSINIHEGHMKIQINIFPKISQIFLQILALAHSLGLKFLQVKTQKKGPIFNDLQEFKEIFEIYVTFNQKNDFPFEIEISFGDAFNIIDNKIGILITDFSFEEFVLLWDFFKEIPKDRIIYEKIIINASNFEFSNLIESILNAQISFNYRFQVSLSECNAENCLEMQNLLQKMINQTDKKIMRIHFEYSQLDLSIVSTFCEPIEVILKKCPSEMIFSILPFSKDVKLTFEDITISFFPVKNFQEFISKLKIIADFPFKIGLYPQKTFSFNDYGCIWEVMNSHSSKIEEIEFHFWGFKPHKTMKINLRQNIYPKMLILELIEFLKPEKLEFFLDDSNHFLKYDFNFNFSCQKLVIDFYNCFCKNIPQTFFTGFQQLKELSLNFFYFGKNTYGWKIEIPSIPLLINFLLKNNPNLEVLKIWANEICFGINFPPQSLKNLLVLEMDFPSYNIKYDGIQEQIPIENKMVALKYLGENAFIKDSIFLKKFPYLTKVNYDVGKKSQIKKITQRRLIYVKEALILKRKLFKIFRKEIIAEILTKID